jgi:hypothetical protein
VADDEVQTGGMIALVPDNPRDFTVPGGDPVGEMHCTLIYLGDDVTSLPEAVVGALKVACANISVSTPPVSAPILGVAVWNRDGGPDGKFKPCTVTTLQQGDGDGDEDDEVPELAMRVRSACRDVLGDALFPQQHEPFLPHVTAGYELPDGVFPKATGTVRFSAIRLALGGENTLYPLTGGQEGNSVYAGKVIEMAGKTAKAKPNAAEAGPQITQDGDELSLYFPCLAVEGMSTSDGRKLAAGSLSTRALPVSIFAQMENPGSDGGHAKSKVIGKLTEAWRIPGPEFISKQTGEPLPEGTFVWQGKGKADANSEGGKAALAGYLTGNSVDLSEPEYTEDVEYAEDGDERTTITMTKAVIAATTLCAIPAFPDAYVEINGENVPAAPEALAASATPMFRAFELGDSCSPCEAEELGANPFVKPEGGGAPITDKASLAKAIAGVAKLKGPAADAAKAKIKAAASKLKLGDQIPASWSAQTASGEPALPPLAWFSDPQLDGPTPLHYDDETGRIFGHIATWNSCHIGLTKRCTPPPRSASDYAHFATGAKRVMDGEEKRTVAVGHLTMSRGPQSGGHASLAMNAQDAVKHYDNTCFTAADVAAGDDAHGIWIAGVVRPDLTDAELNELLASPASGDWRPIDGNLEMVAVLQVNTPGYAVPRARVASSGEVLALTAAGALKPESAFSGGIDIDELATRVAAKLSDLLGGWSREPADGRDVLTEVRVEWAELDRQDALAELRAPFLRAR